MMRRPNVIDWMVYRLFRWWWNPILRENPRLTRHLTGLMQTWWMVKQIEDELDAAIAENQEAR